MKRTLIENGLVVDGSGQASFTGSVLIEGDRIVDVFKAGAALPVADLSLNVNGCVIAPGFIDMHSHADWMLPWNDHQRVLKCLVEQGVTTVIGGNCGISPAPMVAAGAGKTEILAAITMPEHFQYHWTSMADYLDYLETQGLIVNLAELVGHATVRYNTNQIDRGDMRPAELQECLENTRMALDQGACGLSFGLGYDPGMYSTMQELKAFSKIAGVAGKPVTMHMKAFSRISPCYPLTSLTAHNVKALKEAIEIAEETGIRLQLSHFIFVGRKSWKTVDSCLQLVDKARGRGVDIMIDAFPYTCGNTTILAPFPYWFLARLPEAFSNTFLKARLKLELSLGFKLVGFSYPDFQVMDTTLPEYAEMNGLRVSEIAKRWHCDAFDAMLILAEKSKGACLVLFHTYSGEPANEEALEKVLSKDYCLFETDAAIKGSGFPNPASLGTFPRILGTYVRGKKLFSLENAIHRMTAASARRFGMHDIGLLQKGKAADIVCFDAKMINDCNSDSSEPSRRPTGIKQVFINGVQVLENGCYLEEIKNGRVIRC